MFHASWPRGNRSRKFVCYKRGSYFSIEKGKALDYIDFIDLDELKL